MNRVFPLSIINFEGSEFSGSEFSRSEFSGSEFSGSEFSGSEFSLHPPPVRLFVCACVRSFARSFFHSILLLVRDPVSEIEGRPLSNNSS